MRTKKSLSYYLIPTLLSLVPVTWIGLKLAPFTMVYDNIINAFVAMMGSAPAEGAGFLAGMHWVLTIRYCAATLKVTGTLILVWLLAIVTIISSQLNTRYGEEHGSAQWAEPASVDKKLRAKKGMNKIMTQNVQIGFDVFRHKRNLNVVVIGGSGAMKTRGYALPNILSGGCSRIILDPKGEILLATGHILQRQGIEVRVLDLIEMDKSLHYNPFAYLHTENDVMTMVENLFSATTPKNASQSDPFWDNSAKTLLMALSFLVWKEGKPGDQNFATVMELLRNCEIIEGREQEQSPTDILFEEVRGKNPNHIALRYWDQYRHGSAKTLQSIQQVLSSHMSQFALSSVAELTSDDEMDLTTIGAKPVALFCRISDSDKSMNFLVSMLYLQLFQELFNAADLKYRGKLPVHVEFMMDEFANIALPPDFEKRISTARSRNISFSIILQNISQLKSLYKDDWESIVGNCDTLLYLGGNEQSTHEYISKALGKETIWTRSNGMSRGRNGSSSRNDQTSGRELLTPDEVRALDNAKCVLLIRGFPPVLDNKYILSKHPNHKEMPEAKGPEFVHGRPKAVATMQQTSPEPEEEEKTVTATVTVRTQEELEKMLEEGKL